MSTIFFDLDGIVTYPGFTKKIIHPLQEQGRNIRFWTFANENWAYQLLREVGLSEFANPTSCLIQPKIHQEVIEPVSIYLQKKFECDIGGIRVELEKTLRRREYDLFIGLSTVKRISGFSVNLPELLTDEIDRDCTTLTATSHLLRIATRSMEKIGLTATASEPRELIARVLEYQEALSEGQLLFKYPPLLGQGQHLLVESDGSIGQQNGRLLEQPKRFPVSYISDIRAAGKGKYSLLLLPEHPDVWDCPNILITPEAVVRNLRQRLESWQEHHIICDLGIEMGMYQQEHYMSAERV